MVRVLSILITSLLCSSTKTNGLEMQSVILTAIYKWMIMATEGIKTTLSVKFFPFSTISEKRIFNSDNSPLGGKRFLSNRHSWIWISSNKKVYQRQTTKHVELISDMLVVRSFWYMSAMIEETGGTQDHDIFGNLEMLWPSHIHTLSLTRVGR